MGTVLLAEDLRLSRLVALKTFSGPEARSAHARTQLLSEARAAAALSHPNIASVHDVLDVDGEVVIVFEYVDGETLASRLEKGALPTSTALALASQLADALAAAHARGIIHRDLKPGNIILTADGRAKVLDFGIARVIPADPSSHTTAQTAPAMFVGTIGYAAPEQCLGQPVDARADIFSLAVVMFEMLSGRRPFPGDDVTMVMRAMLQSDPPRIADAVPTISPALDDLITRALQRNPAQRPETVGEFREGLRAIVTDRRPPVVAAATRRSLRWAAASMIVVALATAGLVWSLAGDPTTASPQGNVKPVVAVMPLTNASGDSGKDYIPLGVAESLITRLAALPSITVLSRSSVAEARMRIREVPALAKELAATYLVDGSVQQIGDRMRINLSLIRPDGSVAWADTVEGSFSGIFELQTRLASALAQALVVQLTPADRARLAQQPTENADALAAYWRGRGLLERRDVKGNIDAAIASFDEAIRLDQRFADAHAARGEALWARYSATRDAEFVQKAIDAGLEALRIDPQRPYARYALALTLEGSGRLDEAVEELQKALVLQPNYEDARRQLGQVLARQGKIDQAVAEFDKAIALRPNYWGNYSLLGFSLFQAARYDAAAGAFTRVVELQPDSAFGYQQLGTVSQLQGQYDKALEYYGKANAISPNPQAYTNMGAILHQRGDYAGAVAAYRRSLELRPNSHVTQRNLGDTFARMGDDREAQAAYAQAIAIATRETQINERDARTLAYLAVYLAKAKRSREALDRMAQAKALAGGDVQVVYRSAVVHVLSGDADGAIVELRRAIELGYSRKAAAEDEDFRSLHGTDAFKEITR